MNQVLKSRCEEQLNFLSVLLNDIDPIDYQLKLDVLNGSSVGEHVRHCIEFFLCLFDGVDNNNVCYDLRKRNKDIEDDKNQALYFLAVISTQIDDIDSDKNLSILYPQTLGEGSKPIESTLYRELVFCMDHIIHHLAIIKLAIQANFESVSISENFGKAPSTLFNQRK